MSGKGRWWEGNNKEVSNCRNFQCYEGPLILSIIVCNVRSLDDYINSKNTSHLEKITQVRVDQSSIPGLLSFCLLLAFSMI